MCFSAEASFGAGVIIGTVGIYSIKKAQKPNQLLFAATPLIFAFHQISEGFVWIALLNPGYQTLYAVSVSFYLAIAQVLWPFWVPLSVLLIEKEQSRKKIIIAFLIIGTIGALYLAIGLLIFPITAQIKSHHIHYDHGYLLDSDFIPVIFYFLPATIPLFVTSNKDIRILGFVILVSASVSFILFEKYFTSVWCFFAAAISIWVLVIVKKMNKNIQMEH
jgi:hypothetical protein